MARYNQTMEATPNPSVPAGPPRSAPGRLELVRDFVNTADLAEGTDKLTELDGLAAWLRERGLLRAGDRLELDDVARALAVREALRDLLEHRAGGSPDAAAAGVLNAAAAGALLRVAFDRHGTAQPQPVAGGLDRALGELFAIIYGAGIDGTWDRLKVCADDGCRWAFFDHSRNRSRSWCNMASCGNRAKARSYRSRRSAAAGRQPPAH
jgi:predicted RNA-binding Zn ribbon-like protein